MTCSKILRFWVYPRACGEYSVLRAIRRLPAGLPPRLRGAPSVSGDTTWSSRFTPAPAGDTTPPGHGPFLIPVYPRACGEYPPADWLLPLTCGLPPRLRGIRSAAPPKIPLKRFTPAPAGNTLFLCHCLLRNIWRLVRPPAKTVQNSGRGLPGFRPPFSSWSVLLSRLPDRQHP